MYVPYKRGPLMDELSIDTVLQAKMCVRMGARRPLCDKKLLSSCFESLMAATSPIDVLCSTSIVQQLSNLGATMYNTSSSAMDDGDDDRIVDANELGTRSTSMSSCSTHSSLLYSQQQQQQAPHLTNSSAAVSEMLPFNVISDDSLVTLQQSLSLQHQKHPPPPVSPSFLHHASSAADQQTVEQKQRTAMLKRAMTTTNAAERDRLYAALASNKISPDFQPESGVVPRCIGCQQSIMERYMLKVLDLSYHSQCLKCCQCFQPLASKCFVRDGLAYCKADFYTQFGTRCTACERGIPPDSIVRYANEFVFHNECFRCYVCQRKFETGEEFFLLESDKHQLVCKTDYETARNKELTDNSNKRPRTTISAKQLDALKQSYKTSAKPARHVREKLSHDTGLDMRVVQVWFQNRRAKEKRLKREVSRSRWPVEHYTSNNSSTTPTGGGGSNNNTRGLDDLLDNDDDDDNDDDNMSHDDEPRRTAVAQEQTKPEAKRAMNATAHSTTPPPSGTTEAASRVSASSSQAAANPSMLMYSTSQHDNTTVAESQQHNDLLALETLANTVVRFGGMDENNHSATAAQRSQQDNFMNVHTTTLPSSLYSSLFLPPAQQHQQQQSDGRRDSKELFRPPLEFLLRQQQQQPPNSIDSFSNLSLDRSAFPSVLPQHHQFSSLLRPPPFLDMPPTVQIANAADRIPLPPNEVSADNTLMHLQAMAEGSKQHFVFTAHESGVCNPRPPLPASEHHQHRQPFGTSTYGSMPPFMMFPEHNVLHNQSHLL